MKTLIYAVLCCCISTAMAQHLVVGDDGRFLQREGDAPFVWLGDTAWELFHRLDRQEADHYLTTRAAQGFTVIQAVVLAENDGLRDPNPYGAIPFEDLDPTKPMEQYFAHVDYIVRKANDLGLVIGMLPTWGDKLYSLHPGVGPEVFNAENARVYGEYLGHRYEDADIVWILGGDRNVDNLEVLEIWRSMAAGLRSGDGGSHLITFHPRGESHSSYFLHNEDWLDFNMYQSGHARRFNPTYEFALRDGSIQPVKPFVDGEPAYEDIALRFWEYCDWDDPMRVPPEVLDDNLLIADRSHFEDGFHTDYEVRVHAYWNFLSGAAGYTYGNNAVWQMFKKAGPIAIPCLYDWRESLQRPGAQQIKHLKAILERLEIWQFHPDQSLVYGTNPHGPDHVRAAVSDDHKRAVAYVASGHQVQLIKSKLKGAEIALSWFDPRSGSLSSADYEEDAGILTVTTPTKGLGNDWLLLVTSE